MSNDRESFKISDLIKYLEDDNKKLIAHTEATTTQDTCGGITSKA